MGFIIAGQGWGQGTRGPFPFCFTVSPGKPQKRQASDAKKWKEAEREIMTVLKGSLGRRTKRTEPSWLHVPSWNEVTDLHRQRLLSWVSFPQTEVKGSTLWATSPQDFILGWNSIFLLNTSSFRASRASPIYYLNEWESNSASMVERNN